MNAMIYLLAIAYAFIWLVFTIKIINRCDEFTNKDGETFSKILCFFVSLCFTPIAAILYLQAFFKYDSIGAYKTFIADDGTNILVKSKTLESGILVYTRNMQGQVVPLPDGEYKIKDVTIQVRYGAID